MSSSSGSSDVPTAKEQLLTEYFWVSTVSAVAADLPPPRLEFYCDGALSFMLQAEDGDNGMTFILTDYDDYQPFSTCKGEPGKEPRSKRQLDLILDDASATAGNEVFATEVVGTPAGIDNAIDRVVQWYTLEGARWRVLDAIVTKTTITYDACTHAIDRRYDNVQLTRGRTKHRLSRKSETVELYEVAGHAALTTLRTIAYFFEQRAARQRQKK